MHGFWHYLCISPVLSHVGKIPRWLRITDVREEGLCQPMNIIADPVTGRLQ